MIEKVRPGYGVAFGLGALVSHYIGEAAKWTIPLWAQIAYYAVGCAVLICSMVTLVRVWRTDRRLRDVYREECDESLH